MNEPQIAPLKDDTSEWRDKSFWRDLLGFFFTNSVLAWRLKQQLKSRPNVWGIGLWPDAEHEEVAKICAEGLDAGFACESINFIPADGIELIGDLDPAHDMCGAEAIWAIEWDLGLTIPDPILQSRTFGEMVQQIVALRRKSQMGGNGVRKPSGTSSGVCVAETEEVYDPRGLWGFVYGRLGLFSWLFVLLVAEIVLAVVLQLCGLPHVRLITIVVASLIFVFCGGYRKLIKELFPAIGFVVLTLGLSNIIFWYVRFERIADWIRGLF